jgi:Zn-dependent M28 family amino/carboxypeptidase
MPRHKALALLTVALAALASLAGMSVGRGRTGAVPAAPVAPESPLAFKGGRAFEDLKRLVAFGPRPPGSKALGESRAWMEGQLKAAGCTVEEDPFTASTPVGEIPMTNLIAKAAGTKPGIIMLAGHYDTLRRADTRFVGANDGGSSAAMLLEFARLYCRRKNPFNVWLVFFDGEEALVNWSATDSLYGSRHLAQKLAADGEIARLQAMILVDMVADKRLSIYQDTNSTAWLTDLVFKTAAKLGYGKEFLDEKSAYGDDHAPFVDDGVAAVDLLGNVGPPARSSSFGAYWHTAEDTVDKCSPTSLTVVGRVVVATVTELERAPRPH